jgi:hypothetical protein
MTTNMNVLPLPVISAIVAYFDSDLVERHFCHCDARIMIHNYTLYNDGSWAVNATHLSGVDVDIVVTKDLRVGIWASFDKIEWETR